MTRPLSNQNDSSGSIGPLYLENFTSSDSIFMMFPETQALLDPDVCFKRRGFEKGRRTRQRVARKVLVHVVDSFGDTCEGWKSEETSFTDASWHEVENTDLGWSLRVGLLTRAVPNPKKKNNKTTYAYKLPVGT